MSIEDSDDRVYVVLVNAEDQYSLWLEERSVPNGWSKVGPRGTREECLEYVGQVWTDMRPRSLRERSPSQH
jgi:MbtH protein